MPPFTRRTRCVLADAGKVDPAVAEVKKFLGPGSDSRARGDGKAGDRGYYTHARDSLR